MPFLLSLPQQKPSIHNPLPACYLSSGVRNCSAGALDPDSSAPPHPLALSRRATRSLGSPLHLANIPPTLLLCLSGHGMDATAAKAPAQCSGLPHHSRLRLWTEACTALCVHR